MIIKSLEISEVILIEPLVCKDNRGLFYEFFNQKEFNDKTGLHVNFVQDNISYSKKNVLRGLHYQESPFEQGKLVSVISGGAIDVAVDLRKGSKTYGKHIKEKLSSSNRKQLWIPPGFAHGFYIYSDSATFLYKTTNYYNEKHQKTIKWNDSILNIDWELDGSPILSAKDDNGLDFMDLD